VSGRSGELHVPGGVVVVAVGVGHQQLVMVTGMLGQPAGQQAVHRRPQREEPMLWGRAAVHEHRLVVPVQQVEKRRFVVHRHVLAQDHGVLVIVVDLDLRVTVVLGRRRSVDPAHVEIAGHPGLVSVVHGLPPALLLGPAQQGGRHCRHHGQEHGQLQVVGVVIHDHVHAIDRRQGRDR